MISHVTSLLKRVPIEAGVRGIRSFAFHVVGSSIGSNLAVQKPRKT